MPWPRLSSRVPVAPPPRRLPATYNPAMSLPAARQPSELWTVWRIDDNANVFVVREHLTEEEAERVVADFTARGHKQTYWAERDVPRDRREVR